MGMLKLLELTCPTACACLFKLRPGVLSNTLSHMWGKLNLIDCLMGNQRRSLNASV